MVSPSAMVIIVKSKEFLLYYISCFSVAAQAARKTIKIKYYSHDIYVVDYIFISESKGIQKYHLI